MSGAAAFSLVQHGVSPSLSLNLRLPMSTYSSHKWVVDSLPVAHVTAFFHAQTYDVQWWWTMMIKFDYQVRLTMTSPIFVLHVYSVSNERLLKKLSKSDGHPFNRAHNPNTRIRKLHSRYRSRPSLRRQSWGFRNMLNFTALTSNFKLVPARRGLQLPSDRHRHCNGCAVRYSHPAPSSQSYTN